MPVNLHGRSILTPDDLSPAELRSLLRLSQELKAAKHAGYEQQRLQRKNIALIFEKDSTRTRTGFEVAAYDQGAHVTYLGPSGSQIGHKESMKDTARVLGRIYDAIEYRGFGQHIAAVLAAHAGVPVYNGLTEESHPTQTLADFMTMREFTHKHFSEIAVAFVGDGTNNVARSLAIGAAKLGCDMRIVAPKERWPDAGFVAHLREIAGQTGGRILVSDDPAKGVAGCDFLYTDVWLSMGEDEKGWAERIKMLLPYQVNAKLMAATGNPYVKFMHCLPAFHDANTQVGADIEKRFGLSAMEVTDDVFESAASIVFDQAENRMHSIKAILVATLAA